jgi:hypothetical protein
MHTSKLRGCYMVVSIAFIGLIVSISQAWADEVDDCLARLQKAYESPQAFSQDGEITCPPGDIVGFPPRVRRDDRSGAVMYKAPPGYVIENKAVGSIGIANISQNNGSIAPATISGDGTTVAVPISCTGKGPGEGRAWQQVRITGVIVRLPSTEMIKTWALQCVRCVANKSCSAH